MGYWAAGVQGWRADATPSYQLPAQKHGLSCLQVHTSIHQAPRPLPAPTLRWVALSRSRWPDMAPMMPTPVSYASSSTCGLVGGRAAGLAAVYWRTVHWSHSLQRLAALPLICQPLRPSKDCAAAAGSSHGCCHHPPTAARPATAWPHLLGAVHVPRRLHVRIHIHQRPSAPRSPLHQLSPLQAGEVVRLRQAGGWQVNRQCKEASAC